MVIGDWHTGQRNNGSSLTGYGNTGGWSPGAPQGFAPGSSYSTEYRSSTQARAAAAPSSSFGGGASTNNQQRLNPNPALNTQLANTLSNQMTNPGLAQADIDRMVSQGANGINAGAAAQRIAAADRANAFGGGSSGGMLAGLRQISDNAGVQRASNAMQTRLGAAQQAIQDRQHAMGLTDRYLGRLTDQAQSDYRFDRQNEPQPAGTSMGDLQARAMGFGATAAPAQARLPNYGFSVGERGNAPVTGTSFTTYAPIYSGNNSLGGQDARLNNFNQPKPVQPQEQSAWSWGGMTSRATPTTTAPATSSWAWGGASNGEAAKGSTRPDVAGMRTATINGQPIQKKASGIYYQG